MLTNPDRPARVRRSGRGEQGLEVGAAGLGVGLGLVGQAPQDDAGMVLVPGDELLDGASMHLLRDGADRLVRIGRPRAAEEHAAADAEVEPDRGRLVDDDDALTIGLLEHLLGVGVVGGAERVGADPCQEREVVQHGGVVVPAAVHVEVLVLAEAAEVEGLVVDEEPRAFDPHGADADGERVAVDGRRPPRPARPAGHRGSPAPGPRARGRRRGAPPSAPSAAATGVPSASSQPDAHRHARRVGGRDGVADDADAVVDVRDHRHVVDVRMRRRVEPHAAVQARIVEEVVVLPLAPGPVRQHLDDAGRDGLPA